jgi:thymidylate kinase
MPDLTFLLCSNVQKNVQRAKQLSKEYDGGDRIENESMNFHKKVNQEFNKLQKQNPGRIIKIVLADDQKTTQEMIRNHCLQKLKERGLYGN